MLLPIPQAVFVGSCCVAIMAGILIRNDAENPVQRYKGNALATAALLLLAMHMTRLIVEIRQAMQG